MPVTPHRSSDGQVGGACYQRLYGTATIGSGHAGDFFSILLQLQSRPSLFHRREKREHSIQPGHPK